jgi:uncharacterized membrane protein/predicted flap endonuclease-1-like 5' DNA nuclease
MSDKYSFLVIKYPRADTATAAMAALQELASEKVVRLRDAVVVTKTPNGKIKLHQTKDDSTKKGILKGGMIGVLLAVLFGPAGWIALGAAAGAMLGSRDRGVKDKLLKELGQNMTPAESAVAILVEHADWQTAVERMKAHGFGGKVVVSEIVDEDIAAVEKLLADPQTVASVPEELELPVQLEPFAEVAPVAAAEVAAEAAPEAPPEAPEAAPAVPEAPAVEPARAATPEAPAPVGRLPIHEVEGVGPVFAERLAAAGIRTTDDLLAAGARPGGREKIAAETGISGKLILEWIDKADLMRIPGVGPQYSDLLEAAGVDSPTDLSHRNPKKLASTLQEVVAARPGIVRHVPSESVLASWIEESGKLEEVVQH